MICLGLGIGIGLGLDLIMTDELRIDIIKKINKNSLRIYGDLPIYDLKKRSKVICGAIIRLKSRELIMKNLLNSAINKKKERPKVPMPTNNSGKTFIYELLEEGGESIGPVFSSAGNLINWLEENDYYFDEYDKRKLSKFVINSNDFDSMFYASLTRDDIYYYEIRKRPLL